MIRPILSVVAVSGLVACGGGSDGPALYEATNSATEFALVPANPLVIPAALTLPSPTPGGVNRALSDPVRTGPVAE